MTSPTNMVKKCAGLVDTKDVTAWENAFLHSILRQTKDGDDTRPCVPLTSEKVKERLSSADDACGGRLDLWLGLQSTKEPSTLKGYRVAVEWWKGKIGRKAVRALVHSDILAVNAQAVAKAKEQA